MSNKMFVPVGTGPYSVDGTEYAVAEDGTIEVTNGEHVPLLIALGASAIPLDLAPILGERVQSDFGPTQAEHDALRTQYESLVKENTDLIAELKDAEKSRDEAIAALAAVSGGQGTASASGGTSEKLPDSGALADPGFTDASDYQEILTWLKAHSSEVPGNISKANALKAIADIVAASKGEQ